MVLLKLLANASTPGIVVIAWRECLSAWCAVAKAAGPVGNLLLLYGNNVDWDAVEL
jgi:hypothetical protein